MRYAGCTLAFLLLTCVLSARAQEKSYGWSDFVDDYTASVLMENATGAADGDLQDEITALELIHRSPINLDNASEGDLLRLPFLDEKAARAIVAYVGANKPLRSLGELLLIPQLSYQQRQWLRLFVTCNGAAAARKTLAQQLRAGSHELTLRADVPLYERAGFADGASLPRSQRFVGSKWATSLRYRFSMGDSVRFGLSADKDSGEPFMAHGNWPYDSYSAFLFVEPSHARYAVALGDYCLNLGQGLVVGHSYMRGRGTYMDFAADDNFRLKPNTSLSETDFMRGIAGKVDVGRFRLVAFLSYNKIDAVLRGDTITSFLRNGYHRTAAERDRKGNVGSFAAGADVAYRSKAFAIGFVGLFQNYSKRVEPSARKYNRYALRGKGFGAASVYYSLALRRLSIGGEAAMSGKEAFSFVNTVRWSPTSRLNFVSAQRYYGVRYRSPQSSSFGAGRNANNERGLYFGASLVPTRRLALRGYVDYLYRPWPTFAFSAPSHELAAMLNAEGQIGKCHKVRLQYNVRSVRLDGTKDGLRSQASHKLRLNYAQSYNHWSFRSDVGGVLADGKGGGSLHGWLVAQQVACQVRRANVALLCAYFDTDDYATRVYLVEPNVVYGAYSRFVYGRGLRVACVARVWATRHVELSAKYSLTHMLDRHHIGSGNMLIDSASQNDLRFQLRYRL